MIVRVCCVCGLILGTVADRGPRRRSHGYCPRHCAALEAELVALGIRRAVRLAEVRHGKELPNAQR